MVAALEDITGLNAQQSIIFQKNIREDATDILLDDFMVPLTSLQRQGNSFSLQYLQNRKKTAPLPNLSHSVIGRVEGYTDPQTGNDTFLFTSYWDIYAPWGANPIILPHLPTSTEMNKPVPAGLLPNTPYSWQPRVLALALQQDFDFQQLEFAEWEKYVTHSASNALSFYPDF
jgi:hypothetical protein